jgi:2-phosphosulfolactate phosphatase
MEFRRLTLQECSQASGTVVVIDVVRAFTTAAYAFAAGAREIVLTEDIEEAFALRDRFRQAGDDDVLLMGEAGGVPIEGFDLGNSPAAVAALARRRVDLSGRRLVQRTSAGTRGVVCASAGADVLLPSSLVVGSATARYLSDFSPEQVTFVITGTHGRGPLDGDEDAACADYIEAVLTEGDVDPAPYAARVRQSYTGQLFGTPNYPHLAAADIDFCEAVDRFRFCLRVEQEIDLLVMRPVHMLGA